MVGSSDQKDNGNCPPVPPPILASLDLTKENVEKVAAWLSLLVEPGQVAELRVLNYMTNPQGNYACTMYGYFDGAHLKDMVREALRLTPHATGVYWTLNPVEKDLQARACNKVKKADKGVSTKDQEILCRRWILIDVDPVRKEGISSSDEERAAAWNSIQQVILCLTRFGLVRAVLADSGNGYHLLLGVDLPRDDGRLVECLLKSLAARFDTPAVKIDRAVFNPSRLCKLYGTLARKGDNVPSRPHRLSHVIATNLDGSRYTAADLAPILSDLGCWQNEDGTWFLDEEAKGRGSESNNSNANGQHANGTLEKILARARAYIGKMPVSVSGDDGHGDCFEVAQVLIRGYRLSEDQARPLMGEFSSRCIPPWSDEEIKHKLNQASTKSRRPFGYIIDRPSDNGRKPHAETAAGNGKPTGAANGQSANGTGQDHSRDEQAKPDKDYPILTAPQLMAAEFPEPEYAVDGLITGGLVVFAGKPKLGKSFAAYNTALAIASATNALKSIPVAAGSVLYIALEDIPRRLQGRLRQMLKGANVPPPERLHIATRWPQQGQGGLEKIREWLQANRDARLVIIDTWGRFRRRYTSEGKQYEQDYANATPLKELAEEFDITILLVHHTTKGQAEDVFDEIRDSGLHAVADENIVMTRCRGQADAVLHITGRDIEEKDVAIQWNKDYLTWEILPGDATDHTATNEQQEILKAIGRESLKRKDIVKRVKKKDDAVRKALQRMQDANQLHMDAKFYYMATKELRDAEGRLKAILLRNGARQRMRPLVQELEANGFALGVIFEAMRAKMFVEEEENGKKFLRLADPEASEASEANHADLNQFEEEYDPTPNSEEEVF